MYRNSSQYLRLLAALVCLLAALSARPAPAQPLSLGTDAVSPRSRPDGTGFEDRIVAEAFRRIGLSVVLAVRPAERCLRNADLGLDDGLYARVAGVEAEYPNLLRVPEPVSQFVFTAFTRAGGPRIQGWQDLPGHKTAYIIGWKLVERRLKGQPGVTAVRDEEALFDLLAAGRVEVVVAGQHGGQEMLRRKGYRGIVPAQPPLESRDMFLFLNRRHSGLVSPVAGALRQMRADGTLARLTREGLGEAAP